MKLIPLSGKRGSGKFTSVSDEDYEYLSQWKWHEHVSHSASYVGRCIWLNGKSRTILMHREVARRMGLDMSLQVDHRFVDTLDNCRHSLRSATHGQNQANRRMFHHNRTGIKGIYLIKGSGRYRAEIRIDGKRINLGNYVDPNEAADAYNAAAQKYRGEYARKDSR